MVASASAFWGSEEQRVKLVTHRFVEIISNKSAPHAKESVDTAIGKTEASARGRRSARSMSLAVGAMLVVLAVSACGASSTSSSAGSNSTGSSSSILAAAQSALTKLYAGTGTIPPTSGPAAVPGKTVWVISCGQAVPGCSVQTNGAAEAARILGWKVTVFDGNFDANDAYSAGVRQAVAAGANGVILVSIDCDAVKQAVVEAKAANVVVVTQSGFGCSGTTLTTPVTLSTANPSLAEFGQAEGRAQADWLIAHTNAQAVVLNFRFVDNTFAVQIDQGFVGEMARCQTCTVTNQDISLSDFSNPSLFQQKCSAGVLRNPNANAVHVPFDSFVTGGVGQAVVHSGRTGGVQVMGSEGFAANINLIKTHGGQSAAMASDQTWLGWAGADTLNRLFAGTPPAPEGIGFTAVDIDHNLPPDGVNFTSPVNFRTDYQAVWGR
jgi:ribose transport system substrate-binding protein